MGTCANIGTTDFPKQGDHIGRRVSVCFHFNTAALIGGIVVRDDIEEPFRTIIRLDDGRHVLATECQYRPAAEWDKQVEAITPEQRSQRAAERMAAIVKAAQEAEAAFREASREASDAIELAFARLRRAARDA